jgi:hypothetical protein
LWIHPPSRWRPRPASPPNVCKVITPSAYTMSSTRDARRRASISKRCWSPIVNDVCMNACVDHYLSKRVPVQQGLRGPCVHPSTGGVGGYVGSRLRRPKRPRSADQSLKKLAAPSLGRTAKVASADMSADSIYQMQEHRLSVGHIVQLFDCPRARGHVHPLAVLPCKHCAPCKAATRHICQDMVCANGAFALRQFMGIQIGGGIQCRSSTKRRSG